MRNRFDFYISPWLSISFLPREYMREHMNHETGKPIQVKLGDSETVDAAIFPIAAALTSTGLRRR